MSGTGEEHTSMLGEDASIDYRTLSSNNHPGNNNRTRMVQYVNQSTYVNDVIPLVENALRDQNIHPSPPLGDRNVPREQSGAQNEPREPTYTQIGSSGSGNQYEAPPYVTRRPEIVHDHESPLPIKEKLSSCKIVVTIALLVVLACIIASVTVIVLYKNREKSVPKLGSATSSNDIVGITAYKQKGQTGNSSQFILFEAYVFKGNGNHFNGTHFTCPSNGVYFVGLSAKGSTGSSIYMCLKVVRHVLNVLHLCNEFNSDTSTSNVAITRCLKGQNIYVEPYTAGKISVYGDMWIPISTLTIFQVRQEEMSVLKNKPQTYIKQDIVTYETIIYNEANMFNRDTSTIQCKTNGLYLVSITSKKLNKNLQISLVKNTHAILHSINAHIENKFIDIVNNRLVVCHQGDNISTIATGSGDIGNYDTSVTMMLVHSQDNSQQFTGMSVKKNKNQSYKSGDSITFDSNLIESHLSTVRTYSNTGQSTLNYYICPLNGVYLVLANFMKLAWNDLNLNVLVQNRLLFRLSDPGNRSPDVTLSNNVLFKCNEGERVHVEAFGPGEVRGDTYNILTTFTVMLIKEDHVIA